MDQLMQKLMNSKAIMDVMDSKKGTPKKSIPQNMVEDFDMPNVKYNIPQDLLQEQRTVNQPYLSQAPRENTKPVGVPSVEAIKNSRLPDEIKRLMIEHPIVQPQMQASPTLSDELVEKASRLMKENSNNYVPDSAKTTKTAQRQQATGSIDYNLIKEMIKDAVKDVMIENGMINESTEKTNEEFSFKVGKHIFEGRVTKIKKLK